MTVELINPTLFVDHVHNDAGDTLMRLTWYDQDDVDPEEGLTGAPAVVMAIAPEFIREVFPEVAQVTTEAEACMSTHPDLRELDRDHDD